MLLQLINDNFAILQGFTYGIAAAFMLIVFQNGRIITHFNQVGARTLEEEFKATRANAFLRKAFGPLEKFLSHKYLPLRVIGLMFEMLFGVSLAFLVIGLIDADLSAISQYPFTTMLINASLLTSLYLAWTRLSELNRG